jgi:hypothetical protein
MVGYFQVQAVMKVRGIPDPFLIYINPPQAE